MKNLLISSKMTYQLTIKMHESCGFRIDATNKVLNYLNQSYFARHKMFVEYKKQFLFISSEL